MEILNLIFKDCTGLLIGLCVFYYLLDKIENADPESKLYILSDKDAFITCFKFLISNELINYRFTNLFDRCFFMAMFGIMIVHSHTDSKAKIVYRPFNYCLWIIGVLYAVIKLFILNQYPQIDESPIQTVFYIGIFITIMYVFTFVLHASGKGDGYMLIGLSFFVPFMGIDTLFISLIIMLVYYIVSGFIQIFTNLDKLEIKKLRFKEKLPFAPSLLYGLWGMLLLTKLFSTDIFKTWQLENMF